MAEEGRGESTLYLIQLTRVITGTYKYRPFLHSFLNPLPYSDESISSSRHEAVSSPDQTDIIGNDTYFRSRYEISFICGFRFDGFGDQCVLGRGGHHPFTRGIHQSEG